MAFFLKLILSPPVLLFFVLCFVIYYLVYVRQLQRWKLSNIPVTRPFFLLGHRHMFKIFSNSAVVPLDYIYRENPDVPLVAFFLTVSPVILLKDPSLIRKVYGKSFDKMFANGFFPPEKEVAYQSIVPISSDRDLWKVGRNSLAASFSTAKLESSEFGKFKKQVDRLWHHTAKSVQLGKPVNGKEAAHNFIVDSVNLHTFGVDENSWEEKGSLYQLVDSVFGLTYQRLASFFVLTLFPFLQAFDPLRFMRHDHIDSVTKFVTEKVQERDQLEIRNDDYIDRLMSLRGKTGSEEAALTNLDTNENPAGLGVKEMVGHTLTWLLAGTDTSSQLCLFATHLLSLHPEYQDRIRAEVNGVMRKLNTSEITFQVVHQLQLTEYCLLETSRLYPILPALMRCCSEDFQIPGTKYVLRKGDRVFILPYSMHRDPRYFKEPDRFYPERFSPENRHLACLDMYVSFGTGPRKCPGYKIGVSLAALFIASLLHKYQIRPRSHLKQMDATDFDPRGFTAQHSGQFLVDLVPIESPA
nr:PREDICTED: cytochrome P450 6k1-like [Bemisia tabaci]